MKIHVPSIPDEGLKFSFSDSDGWFRGMLTERLSDLDPNQASTWAKLDLFRTNQNVTLSGRIHIEIRPPCSRCGADFSDRLEIPLSRHLVPLFEGPREKLLSDEEEVELNEEDLEFSFYHNEEIDLRDILAEEILLAMPMRFLCSEACKGLCPKCGVNLNERTCNCSDASDISPFSALKGFKTIR